MNGALTAAASMTSIAAEMEPAADQPPVVEVTIPVYNEAHVLRTSIERLHRFLLADFPFSWRIAIVDNASTDGTDDVARELEAELDGVRLHRLERKGRGFALKSAWLASDARVVAYMDVDLSTGLNALLPLVAPILSGHSDLSIGSRLAPGAAVARGPRREFISRCYNAILRAVFLNRFRDAQCGFKAIDTRVAGHLLPEVVDDSWFFDTELLLLAEHNGLRVFEVPVDWVDDPDSRVDVSATAADDLRGVARMARTFLTGGGRVDLGTESRPSLTHDMGRHVVGFGFVGALSTVATLALFLVLRHPLGAVPASIVAFSAITLVNAWANRRFTFGNRTRRDRDNQWFRMFATFVAGVAVSTVALAIAVAADAPLWVECATLLGAWLLMAVVRFHLLRTWVFEVRHSPRAVERTRLAGSRPTQRFPE